MGCYLQLTFAKFQQKTNANVRFTDADMHSQILAKGLGVKCDINLLALVCSSGIMPDAEY